MDEKLVSDWNKVVGGNDHVYMLGDFTMLRAKSILDVMDLIKRLNGIIHIVFGNHDHKPMWMAIAALMPHKVKIEGERAEVNVHGQDITLCHYSHQVWNRSHFGSWHLFGHSHNTLPGIGKSMDVGVDSKYALHFNWAPFSFDEIKTHMDQKEIFGKVND